MAYSAYDVARQILQIRAYVEVHASGFAELPKDVLSALLHLTAEWRNVQEMDMLIQIGADPHYRRGGFSVLENFIQGHDGYWTCKDRVKEVEDGVKMLVKYGVTHNDLAHLWILKNCRDLIQNSEYLLKFFENQTKYLPEFENQTKHRVKFYFHAPRAESLTESPMTFKDIDDAVKTLHCMTDLDQYVAVLEYQCEVTRYLVSKGCGHLTVIPMESKPGWSKDQERVSNIVNFVMARDDYPTLVCEDEATDE